MLDFLNSLKQRIETFVSMCHCNVGSIVHTFGVNSFCVVISEPESAILMFKTQDGLKAAPGYGDNGSTLS